MYDEYLRRNLIVAKACGAKAGVSKSLKRLEQMSRPPKWLVASLRGVLERVDPLPEELAKWRNTAPDTPENMRPALETVLECTCPQPLVHADGRDWHKSGCPSLNR